MRMLPTSKSIFASLAILMVCWAPPALRGTSWPTLHNDAQRSGYTEEFIRGPYERKWFRDFHDEMIATRVEAIVAEGLCFAGTFAGKIHALDARDGRTVWQFQAGGPIGHSGLYFEGRVYFGSDDGKLYCLRAADGEKIWEYDAGASIWVAPAGDGEKIYFGDRAGIFHAVDAVSGARAWIYETDGMILKPASISPDQRKIVFGSEEMRVYCLDPEGNLLWKSKKLAGLSLRDHGPTIWKGLVLVRSNPLNGFHHAAGQNPEVLTRAQKALPMEPGDEIIFDQWGTYSMRLTPRRLEAERRAILQFLREHPDEQTFFAFDLETGREPWTAPILYTGGLHNPATPPTFDPNSGDCYVWVPTALGNYSAGVPGGAAAVGRLDRDTGFVEILWHANGDKVGWAFDFAAPADETQSLSLMNGILLNTHQGIIGGLNLETLKWHRVYIARDTYGGIFGPAVVPGSFAGSERAHREGTLALMANEWHGPDRSIAAIAEKRFFWVAGSQVVCLGGPDTPRTGTGGTQAPPLIRRKVAPVVSAGNVAAGGVGEFNDAVEKKQFQPEALRGWMRALPESDSGASGALSARAREKLEAAVLEVIDGHPWAPFVVELGISGVEIHFQRTSETMEVVARAWPHLSSETQRKAKRFLDELHQSGVPLRHSLRGNQEGNRREWYRVSAAMLKYPGPWRGNQPILADLYALWAYAHHADAWEKVLADLPGIEAVFERFASDPIAFDHHDKDGDAAEHLNGNIAGALAYARIMEKAGRDSEVQRALERLAEMMAERVHHERADTRFVRATRVAQYKLHQAKIPRYVGLKPELSAFLRQHSAEPFQKNGRDLAAQLPVWHHAFGERLIGGENYISPPHLARGIFAALAGAGSMTAKELTAYLDQPWCRADLYHIEKLTAILECAGP